MKGIKSWFLTLKKTLAAKKIDSMIDDFEVLEFDHYPFIDDYFKQAQ